MGKARAKEKKLSLSLHKIDRGGGLKRRKGEESTTQPGKKIPGRIDDQGGI